MNYVYQIFGLNFSSPVILPNIKPCLIEDYESIDVVISFENIINEIEKLHQEELFDGMTYQVGLDSKGNICTSADFDGIARYWIENKSKIVVERKVNAADTDVFSYLMSVTLASLLYQREALLIHSGAVNIDGKAAMVLGDSGAGKTTTIAKFAHLGYDMLSEDITLVEFINNKPHVRSGIPYLKLLPQTAKIVEQDWNTLTPLYRDDSKKAWTLPNFNNQLVPLEHIFWLQKENVKELSVNEIGLEESFNALASNLHYPILFGCYEIDEICTEKALNIVEEVPFLVVQRPENKNTINEIIELIRSKSLLSSPV